ncbi:hypothetical protein NUW58_g9053 [Xylaria curta]|uniref:Uncharacterized protein n=1 Tax=Xylaria curta TaxID=42375 RepID=A0ACC1N1P2_9PEZI|nr:hypothetical protein NUW58_g9053 [Xylaria curta]
MGAAMAGVQGHVDRFRADAGKLWADMELQAMAALHYLGRETNARSLAEAIEILCKLQVNSFNRLDEDVEQTGLFMNPALAMVNHSCIPNAFVQFVGRKAVLHAYQEIKKDEEIEISYIATVDEIHPWCSAPLSGVSEPDRQKQIRRRWAACKPLRDPRSPAYAIEPLPRVLTEASMFFGEQGNFAYGLCISAFLATRVDPYKAAAPFAPQRVKGLLMVAKLLANTAPADTGASTGESKAVTSAKSLRGAVEKALGKMDQATVCQTLLELVVYYAPAAHSEEWSVLREAKDLLADIEALPSRETEDALIKAFVRNPNGDGERRFFEQAILSPLRELSDYCLDIMDSEFS